MKKKLADKKPTFTLVEILLITALIAILAAVVVFAINPLRQLAQARNAERASDARAILDSINQYIIDNNEPPPGVDDVLRVLGTNGANCNVSCGQKLASLNQGWVYLGDKIDQILSRATIAEAAPLSSWISPSGFQDAGNQWDYEAAAYDGNTGSYAQDSYGGTGWGEFIVLTLPSAITSDRVRVNADYMDAVIAEVDVDVYRDGAWVDVFQGGSESLWNCKWVELTFARGQVSQARFRYNYNTSGYYYWLYEFQFYQTVDNITPPVCALEPATSIQKTAAIMHAQVADDGGEPNQYRFQYGLTTAYGNTTAWTGNQMSGDIFSELVSGLNPYSTYHFQAQIKNSTSTVSCADNTFTTKLVDTGWVLPLGDSDPDNQWENEFGAYDDTFSTYARDYHGVNEAQWGSFIYLNRPEMPTNSVRFYGRGGGEVDLVDVDVYKDGAWENVYEGAFADKQWVEKSFTSGLVTEARVRFHAAFASHGFFFELYEFSFQKSSETGDDACLDLTPYLVSKYIVDIPNDPSKGTSGNTYYAVKKSPYGRVAVYACGAELEKEIILSH